MEMSKRTHIKNMRYEDFKDNEYLEQYVEELRKGGAPVVVPRLKIRKGNRKSFRIHVP